MLKTYPLQGRQEQRMSWYRPTELELELELGVTVTVTRCSKWRTGIATVRVAEAMALTDVAMNSTVVCWQPMRPMLKMTTTQLQLQLNRTRPVAMVDDIFVISLRFSLS
jgi:hypothetical protein